MNKIIEIIQERRSAGDLIEVKENIFPSMEEFDAFLMLTDKKAKTINFATERQKQAVMEQEIKNGANSIAFLGIVGESVLIDLDSLWIRETKDEEKIGEVLYPNLRAF